MRGSSEPKGSWKTIWASLAEAGAARVRRGWQHVEPVEARPCRRCRSISRRIRRASVLLPQPLSPTSAIVSPACDVEVDLVARPRASSSAGRRRARHREALAQPAHAGGAAQRIEAGAGCSSGARGRPRRARGRGASSSQTVDPVRAARREAAGRREVAAGGARCRRSPAAGCAASRGRACCAAGPACRGGAGPSKIVRTGPLSTISPAYMTATRSAISLTTPRLWVIRSTLIPSSARSSQSRSRICAWIVTSSAVVGSSAISSLRLEHAAPWRSSRAGACRRRTGAGSR